MGPIPLALFYKYAIIPYDVILSFGVDLSSSFFLRCTKLGALLFSVPGLVSHPLMHHSSLSAPFLVCYSPFFNGHSKAHHSLCQFLVHCSLVYHYDNPYHIEEKVFDTTYVWVHLNHINAS